MRKNEKILDDLACKRWLSNVLFGTAFLLEGKQEQKEYDISHKNEVLLNAVLYGLFIIVTVWICNMYARSLLGLYFNGKEIPFVWELLRPFLWIFVGFYYFFGPEKRDYIHYGITQDFVLISDLVKERKMIKKYLVVPISMIKKTHTVGLSNGSHDLMLILDPKATVFDERGNSIVWEQYPVVNIAKDKVDEVVKLIEQLNQPRN